MLLTTDWGCQVPYVIANECNIDVHKYWDGERVKLRALFVIQWSLCQSIDSGDLMLIWYGRTSAVDYFDLFTLLYINWSQSIEFRCPFEMYVIEPRLPHVHPSLNLYYATTGGAVRRWHSNQFPFQTTFHLTQWPDWGGGGGKQTDWQTLRNNKMPQIGGSFVGKGDTESKSLHNHLNSRYHFNWLYIFHIPTSVVGEVHTYITTRTRGKIRGNGSGFSKSCATIAYNSASCETPHNDHWMCFRLQASSHSLCILKWPLYVVVGN